MSFSFRGNCKPSSAILQLGRVAIVVERSDRQILVSIVAPAGEVICSADVLLVAEDAKRLCRWIDSLEQYNFLNAPEVVFVNFGLEIELAFTDVDDVGVTVTVFLTSPHDALDGERAYRGVRGQASREGVVAFAKELMAIFEVSG